MAIIIEEKKNMSMMPIVIAVSLSVCILGAIIYYLFFSPVPGIDDFLTSATLKEQIEELTVVSNIEFDVTSIETSEMYGMLLQNAYLGSPAIGGKSGRPRPFDPF
ncbi:MAG: hypothetical protein V1652_03050 [bacterium]